MHPFPAGMLAQAVGAVATPVAKPQDVFATSLYTGNSGTQTITNGIDFTQGGLAWIKCRSTASTSHELCDTARPLTSYLFSDSTAAEGGPSTGTGVQSFSATGFTVGNDGFTNASGRTYVNWSFRQASKFFQVVTYTGDGTSNRQIAHSLGIAPGMVIVKGRSGSFGVDDWIVYHRSLGLPYLLRLNGTGSQENYSNFWLGVDASKITISNDNYCNNAGTTYVAYLFAHDTSANGIIQCGNFTAPSSGATSVNLGWTPQFLLMKRADGEGSWSILDAARSINNYAYLLANSSQAEGNNGTGYVTTSSTGFSMGTGFYGAGANVIYMAIRAPIFTGPTRPQDAFATSLITSSSPSQQTIMTGLNMAGAGGMAWLKGRQSTDNHGLWDTARGVRKPLSSSLSQAEVMDVGNSGVYDFLSNGISIGPSYNLTGTDVAPLVAWSFLRKSKFFDVVTWTGNGVRNTVFGSATNAGATLNHALGIKPGAIFIKARTNATKNDWLAAFRTAGGYDGHVLLLNSTSASEFGGTSQLDAFSDASTFVPGSFRDSTGNFNAWNENGVQYVAYLFAHDPDTSNGIIQCGSYTEPSSGTTQIALGWRPQFLLVKAASTTSDWCMMDDARGLSAGAAKTIFAESSAAESDFSGYFITNPTGFLAPTFFGSGNKVVYIAIRAPTT